MFSARIEMPWAAIQASTFPLISRSVSLNSSPFTSHSTDFQVRTSFLMWKRGLHKLARDGPSTTLKRKVAELEKMRKQNNSKRDRVFVEVPPSKKMLDTATMPMILTTVGFALFAKLLMMYDDSRSQEMIERKIRNAPPERGSVRMLSREEWEGIREVRPRTPFESKLARPNARIRTGDPLRKDDVKDWTMDVLTDALQRVEESVRHGSNRSQ